MTTGPNDPSSKARSWTEHLEIAGGQLVDRVKELIAEGNVRRLIIRHEGRIMLEIPLTVATTAGAATIPLLAPVLAALGAVAALVAHVQVEIVREGDPPA
jgi:hypothetical protein